MIMVGETEFRPVGAACWDAPTRLADMAADGVDVQVVSPTPVFFSYDRPADQAVKVARIFNDLTLEVTAAGGDRLVPFCQVPLQDPDAACAELDRCLAAGHVGRGDRQPRRRPRPGRRRGGHLPPALRAGRRAGLRAPVGHARRAPAGPLDGALAHRHARRDAPVGAGADPRRRLRPRAGDAADLLRARRRQLPVLAGPCRQRLAPPRRPGTRRVRRTAQRATSTGSAWTRWSSSRPRCGCWSTRWGRTGCCSAATTRTRWGSARSARWSTRPTSSPPTQRAQTALGGNALRFLGLVRGPAIREPVSVDRDWTGLLDERRTPSGRLDRPCRRGDPAGRAAG